METSNLGDYFKNMVVSIVQNLKKGFLERRLSVRECARIQTFPDNYQFIRDQNMLGTQFSLSTSSAYKLIGNAVPPLLAFHLAWKIQEEWSLLFGEVYDNYREQKTAVADI